MKDLDPYNFDIFHVGPHWVKPTNSHSDMKFKLWTYFDISNHNAEKYLNNARYADMSKSPIYGNFVYFIAAKWQE